MTFSTDATVFMLMFLPLSFLLLSLSTSTFTSFYFFVFFFFFFFFSFLTLFFFLFFFFFHPSLPPLHLYLSYDACRKQLIRELKSLSKGILVAIFKNSFQNFESAFMGNTDGPPKSQSTFAWFHLAFIVFLFFDSSFLRK